MFEENTTDDAKQADTKLDEITGRAKEAAGALTDNDELKQEGADDQRAAEAKGLVDRAADAVKGGIDDLKDEVSR